ncbi:hypothetical protein HETIRDRAFT_306326 [Heterobasidion irregulare TC 32-1]|uniref:Uncharacterized protein n=1 Tax=Heterobasidion irregulare (strain TC 32-1) TaxID=747525 RepID=W4KKX7_HETIT|nr:uncharacterized protein HETIRDRAFT_306326 [Heterobasidion irregulare TC 32-1]ETW86477.1 hypothetical protein HETIRDRAFT_306326 [Heterobasidion irregulare TC 32-1]
MLIGSSLSKGSGRIADSSTNTGNTDVDSQSADCVSRSIDSGVKRPGLKRSRDFTPSRVSTPAKRLREAESTHMLSAQTLIDSLLYLLISLL